MRRLLDKIKLVAETDSTVLIIGESGTGKELVANAIHLNSPRKEHPLIKVCCADVAEDLLGVGTLRPSRKARFVGVAATPRAIRNGEHKEPVLDEIGSLSLALQAKIVRLIQEKRFQRVGGRETIDVDVRIISAAQEDHQVAVTTGRFRRDLYDYLTARATHRPASA